jgi:hypothetical protein
MILYMQLGYTCKPTPEQIAVLKEMDPSFDVYPPDAQFEWQRGTARSGFRVDPFAIVRNEVLRGLDFRIDGGAIETSTFTTLVNHLEDMIKRHTGHTHPNQYNTRCDVHVPNLGLLKVSKVELLQDACTDDLQAHLDRGWRILAICPQPNQRRPDYIIGCCGEEDE